MGNGRIAGIRIVLAEQHRLMRRTIRMLLEKDGDCEVIGEAETGHQAIMLTQELSPDILLIDVSISDMIGPDIVRAVLAKNQHITVIALSTHQDKPYKKKLLEAGASAFLLKDKAFEELGHVIKITITRTRSTRR
jgi:two-component system, NarL family, response regulator NreC